MNDEVAGDPDPVLRVQLEVHLDSQPVHGFLETEWGVREPFVGWLGFVDVLKRVHEQDNALHEEHP